MSAAVVLDDDLQSSLETAGANLDARLRRRRDCLGGVQQHGRDDLRQVAGRSLDRRRAFASPLELDSAEAEVSDGHRAVDFRMDVD